MLGFSELDPSTSEATEYGCSTRFLNEGFRNPGASAAGRFWLLRFTAQFWLRSWLFARTTPKVQKKEIIKKPDTIVEAKKDEPEKPQEPEHQEASSEPDNGGQPGGVPGGVAGGVVGGVVGGVLGGTLGGTGKTEVIPFGPGMTPLQRLSGDAPIYNKEAMAAKIEGRALYRCTVTLEGHLTNCSAIKSLQFMDQAMKTALEGSWRYAPISFQGRPVSVSAVISVLVKAP